jgi:molybdenum cofactor synthesis domain-containing protein
MTFSIRVPADVKADDLAALGATPLPGMAHLEVAPGELPVLRAGWFLDGPDGPGGPLLQVEGRSFSRTGPRGGAVTVVRTLADIAGGITLTHRKQGISLAWITLSDAGARGEREDASGPAVEEIIRRAYDVSLARGYLLPDDEPAIRALLTDLALVQGFDLILTTGGTGLTPRDVTPEATLAVIEKRLAALETAMTNASLAKTHHACLSRAVAGTLGQSMIINLPGSPKAVTECLEAVAPCLGHGLAKLQGDNDPCAR